MGYNTVINDYGERNKNIFNIIWNLFLRRKNENPLKILLGFFMFRILSGQELPQPLILGQGFAKKTLKISKFVEVSENIGVMDDE